MLRVIGFAANTAPPARRLAVNLRDSELDGYHLSTLFTCKIINVLRDWEQSK